MFNAEIRGWELGHLDQPSSLNVLLQFDGMQSDMPSIKS